MYNDRLEHCYIVACYNEGPAYTERLEHCYIVACYNEGPVYNDRLEHWLKSASSEICTNANGKITVINSSYAVLNIHDRYLGCVNIHEFLSRLYKSLGEYDVVSAVLSKHVTTHPVTLQAIDAEVRGDYTLAVKLYNQVANTNNTMFIVLSSLRPLRR